MFKLTYFRDPTERASPLQSGKGASLIGRGLNELKKKLAGQHARVNSDKQAKRVIHGFAYLYGFQYQTFKSANFRHAQHWSYQSRKLTTGRWIKLLLALRQQLAAIQRYPNIGRLIRSKYRHVIQIKGIQRYYHQRVTYYAGHVRKALKQLGSDQRYRFTGHFARFGRKPNGQLTILLTHVTYRQQPITDHLWFNATKGFRRLHHLQTGEPISFNARVHRYHKGYLTNDFIQKTDFDLQRPTQVKRGYR